MTDTGLIIDARGHRCPTPTLRLRRALETASPGVVVRLRADDPLARIDVPHFCAGQGHRVERMEDGDGELVFWVRKGG